MIKTLQKLPRWLKLAFIFPLLFLNGILLAFILNYLQPFFSFLIIASILAFLLELLIELMIQKGVKRGLAITLVLLLALLLFALIGFIVVPLMVEQLAELIDKVPEWLGKTNDFFISKLPLFEKLPIDINSLIDQAKAQIATVFQSIGSKTLEIVTGTIASVFNALIILILTIFLLVAGEKFWEGIFSWFPSPWHQRIPTYLYQSFKDYFFARLILAGISSVARLIVFLMLGVPSAILFAFGIGIASLIPFVAAIVTIFGTLLLVFNSISLALWFLISAIIIDQVTDNVLQPRLMGEAIGLNPVWLLISLFIGAKMGGLLGVFLAVPLASVIKRIIDDLRSGNYKMIEEENKEDDNQNEVLV